MTVGVYAVTGGLYLDGDAFPITFGVFLTLDEALEAKREVGHALMRASELLTKDPGDMTREENYEWGRLENALQGNAEHADEIILAVQGPFALDGVKEVRND